MWHGLLRAVVACALAAACAFASAGPKVLRLALPQPESGFDPAKINDTVSASLTASLFDAPLTYDFLARPARLKPNTAAALPEVSDNHQRFVFTIRPGIHFTDDPAFKGARRELTAADYVYSVKRFYDPKVRSPVLFHFENAGLLGLSELRREAIERKQDFPYDTEVAGIRALDRYRFEVRTSRPAPRLPYVFGTGAITGALAREVVEADPEHTMERPVGTGPFRLAAWKRAARIVLERNPHHQHGVYDEQPPADDAEGQALAARLRGRKLPLVDRIEFSVIEEAQPRWLAFLNGQLDALAVPTEFANLALPGGQLAPHLARRGIQFYQSAQPSTMFTYFNMESPLVGGYTPERIALRRAIGLAYDARREIDLVRNGQAMVAQSVLPPLVSGFDPALKSEMSDYSPARARALLDLYGFVDRDGDGWREQPDGKPLVLELAAQPDQLSRQLQGLWKKAMDGIGIRITFRIATWPEQLKASRAGKLMMWGTGWFAAFPDGGYFLDLLYGPNKGQANRSRFDLPAMNAIYERQRVLPDGPEREALFAEAKRLAAAYMPLKSVVHVTGSWLSQPQVLGYRPHPFLRDPWRYVDVDESRAAP